MDHLCNICPRSCNVNRKKAKGFCGAANKAHVARADLHFYEEPPVSGTNGSGAIFFSGCNMSCVFCQNLEISKTLKGEICDEHRLCDLFLALQEKGAHNINLVTPGIHFYILQKAIAHAKNKGLTLPIVYNTNAYEKVETIKALDGLVDIYLPDLKYVSGELSQKLSSTPDYFMYAAPAIIEMHRQVGILRLDEKGIAEKGIIIRHLVLPGCLFDTRAVLDFIRNSISINTCVSLMAQYTPLYENLPKPFDRKITKKEYQIAKDYCLSLGFYNVYIQGEESADRQFIPKFFNELTDL